MSWAPGSCHKGAVKAAPTALTTWGLRRHSPAWGAHKAGAAAACPSTALCLPLPLLRDLTPPTTGCRGVARASSLPHVPRQVPLPPGPTPSVALEEPGPLGSSGSTKKRLVFPGPRGLLGPPAENGAPKGVGADHQGSEGREGPTLGSASPHRLWARWASRTTLGPGCAERGLRAEPATVLTGGLARAPLS